MKEALSFAERNALKSCEATIERGLETFSAVGAALLKIRDEHLYRAKHKNFEEYCKERWGMSRAHAYRQMEAAGVIKNLSPMGDKTDASLSPIGDKTEPVVLPGSERQARELVHLSAEEQRAAWKEAVEESQGEQPTAQAVAQAARRHAPCRIPRKPLAHAEESPLGQQLHKKHDADLEHHRYLTVILASIEELAQPKIDILEVSREILMVADRRRQYESQVRQAHQMLGCLLDAMRRIA